MQDAQSASLDYDPQTNLKPTDRSPIAEIAAQLKPQLINALACVLCDKLNQNSQSSATIWSSAAAPQHKLTKETQDQKKGGKEKKTKAI